MIPRDPTTDPEGLAAGIHRVRGRLNDRARVAVEPCRLHCEWRDGGGLFQGSCTPLPLMNFGELVALYSFLFLFIAARGAAQYSLGALLVSRVYE